MTKFYYILFLTLGLNTLYGQVMEVTNSAPITPLNLISNVFLGDGVEVVQITYEGDPLSVGLFTNGSDDIGMERGIVMTTGRAVTGAGGVGVNSAGTTQSSLGTTSTVQDADLQQIVGQGTAVNDVAKYTIEFIPTNDTLQFTYSFASEEYPEFVCSDYNDVFGFFISGPGINGIYQNGGENIALIPGTDRPVTINNINPGQVGASGILANCQGDNGSLAYSQYYNGNQTNSFPVYDGYTDVLVAQAVVMPCSTYTIKLLIGDVTDNGWDSGVFLEAKSFGTGSLEVEIDGLAVDGGLAEGCATGEITFRLPMPTEADYDVELEVGGSATPGVDYPALPPTVIIPEGDSTATIFLSAFEDNIDEGNETIIISVKRDACNRDTFVIVVKDNILLKPDLGPDQITCPTDDTPLDGTVPVPLPEPPRFENNTPLEINMLNTPFISEIDVFGVLPLELGPEAILSICIDSLEHRWIDDLDIFLVTPGGQFLELTTDNGADGGNGLGIDNYLQTCFTVDATTPINFPGPLAPASSVPFTGNWLPEGVWSDLWDGDNPTNGTWQLVLTDDQNGLDGTLFSWSITFNPVYQIDYSWDPVEGLSCSDCPDPIASPDVSTTYILTVSDSYGCMESDTIDFEVLPALPMSEVTCGLSTTSSVQVGWDDVVGISGYEVSIDGGPWMPANEVLGHSVTGLGLSQDVEIIVRGLSQCPTFPDTVICRTLDCVPAELSATPTSVSCFSGTDGSVQINIVSGTAPFTYQLDSEMSNTGLFDNLSAGLHTAIVRDGDDCPSMIEFMIDEPPSPTFTTIVEQAIDCNGDTDGALTVSIEDGNGPYMFNWDNAAVDSIATNLTAGDYNVQLTDAQNCTYQLDLVLLEPELLEGSIEGSDALCASSATGQAWVTANGGSGSYTYQWDDGQLLDTAFLLTAATYQVVVTDSLNCTLTLDVDISEPPALILANPVSSAVTCNGEANGSSSIEVSGGTMPYQYTWVRQATGEMVGDQATAVDLTAGDYDLFVADANGCSETLLFSIVEPAALELFNLQTAIPTCVGVDDGSGQIEVQGGTPPYDVNWDSGSVGMNTNILGGPEHWVAVSDANDCVDTLFFTLGAPQAIMLTLTADSVSCFGGADGSALVEAIGGAMPYTYSWNGGISAMDLAENLSAGIQTIDVLDDNNCLATATVEVFEPTVLELSLAAVDPTCFQGINGSVMASPQGGSQPYSFMWDDGQTDQSAIGLSAQTIGATITDANACIVTESIELNEPLELTATTATQEQACAGAPNGEALASPVGGTPPYTYEWNDGQITQTANSLVAGVYSVTVTDSQLCTFTVAADVPMAETVSISNFDLTDVSCNGGNDGEVAVELTGGTAPFTWSESLTSLSAGNYSLSVTDVNSCTDFIDVIITEPEALELSGNITHVVCAGEQSGAVDLSVSGGTVPYMYRWNTGLETEDLSGLFSATYTVSVEDANGCMVVLESFVNEATQLSLSTDFTDVECFGYSTGTVAINGVGGEPPYTYAWNNGSTESQQSTLSAGDYSLTMTDIYGCEISESITISQPDPIVASFTSEDVDCFGGRDGIIKLEGNGGTPPYRYRYNNEFWQSSPTFIGLFAGTYTLQLEDANGCPLTVGTANIVEPPIIVIDLEGDRDIRFGETINIIPNVHSQNPIVSYEWLNFDSTWMACQYCIEQSVFPDYTADLFLAVVDANGCKGEEWIRIRVSKDFPVRVPTGFTPNGDLTNDLLVVHGLPGIQVLSFQVWDRWGEMIYEQVDFEVNNNALGWDGSFRGQDMNSGIYVWKAEVMLPDGKVEQLAGQTTLIR